MMSLTKQFECIYSLDIDRQSSVPANRPALSTVTKTSLPLSLGEASRNNSISFESCQLGRQALSSLIPSASAASFDPMKSFALQLLKGHLLGVGKICPRPRTVFGFWSPMFVLCPSRSHNGKPHNPGPQITVCQLGVAVLEA